MVIVNQRARENCTSGERLDGIEKRARSGKDASSALPSMPANMQPGWQGGRSAVANDAGAGVTSPGFVPKGWSVLGLAVAAPENKPGLTLFIPDPIYFIVYLNPSQQNFACCVGLMLRP